MARVFLKASCCHTHSSRACSPAKESRISLLAVVHIHLLSAHHFLCRQGRSVSLRSHTNTSLSTVQSGERCILLNFGSAVIGKLTQQEERASVVCLFRLLRLLYRLTWGVCLSCNPSGSGSHFSLSRLSAVRTQLGPSLVSDFRDVVIVLLVYVYTERLPVRPQRSVL